ncbi:MAG: serine protease [bacterium]|nr:serine protease [bacterium]
MENNKHTIWFALLVIVSLASYGLYSETRKELREAQVQIAELSGDVEAEEIVDEEEVVVDEPEVAEEDSKQPAPSVTSQVTPVALSTGAIINQFAPAVVRLVCADNATTGASQQGSGVLFSGTPPGGSGLYYVQTSLHVIETSDGSLASCTIEIYPNQANFENYNTFASTGYSLFSSDVDLAYIVPQETTGSRAGSLGSLSIYALPSSQTNICQTVEIGDHVSVLGYPKIGGKSLTVTDGIVSGFEIRNGERYIKTSAKIDQGNSGGIAIKDSGCVIGIPTYVQTQIESLGRILDLRDLVN